jgi:4-hydroxy-2-oxoheptanedioate aldolase
MARINRAIELLEAGQPIYYTGPSQRNYEGGEHDAATWADYICYDVEHGPFDMTRLGDYMRGMAAKGPTRSGHRTPSVIVTLPMEGVSVPAVQANSWMVKQALATGVHGLLLCHAEDPAAVRIFVEAARYTFQKIGLSDRLSEGRRGNGGQGFAGSIWGMPADDYLLKADTWPLNPDGEIMLGLKIENRKALSNVEETVKVPGLSFAEWGPGDMGMSFGYVNRHDPPYPPEMIDARNRVFNACKAAGIAFLESVRHTDVTAEIDEGVRICAGATPEQAEAGRKHTKRTLPW